MGIVTNFRIYIFRPIIEVMGCDLDDYIKIGFFVFACAACYVFGYQNADSARHAVFEPNFGEGANERSKCLVVIERLDNRYVFAGCRAEPELKAQFESWKKAGVPWPYQVVAEFNREIDG